MAWMLSVRRDINNVWADCSARHSMLCSAATHILLNSQTGVRKGGDSWLCDMIQVVSALWWAAD
jgi:hypothetical protein